MKVLAKYFLVMATAISPIVIGCDRTVSEKTSTERKSDGTVVKEHDKTTVDDNGNMNRTTEKKVDRNP